jgi:hypothetical protein
LKSFLEEVVLPTKGKRNQEAQEEETDNKFQEPKHQYYVVESVIESLQNHGLKICKNKGLVIVYNYIKSLPQKSIMV